MWFTEYNGHKIGKITPAGAITEYPVPTAGSRPDQITTGPDGKMWFTHVSTNKIGEATTSSFVDEVSETVQLARTSRRFFDPPDRDQAVEDVDDELERGAWLRTRLVSRR
jgi:streptogramin lyase